MSNGEYSDFPSEGFPGDGPNDIKLKHSEPVYWGRKQMIWAIVSIVVFAGLGWLLIYLTTR